LSKDITPVEAGLKYFIKLDKLDFNGKEILKEQIENKPSRIIVGFEMIEKGIARNDYIVYDEQDNEIGFVTSGSFSPTLKKNLGLALVKRKYIKRGTLIFIGIRKKKIKAEVIRKPFYSKKYKK